LQQLGPGITNSFFQIIFEIQFVSQRIYNASHYTDQMVDTASKNKPPLLQEKQINESCGQKQCFWNIKIDGVHSYYWALEG
jgi:hypothetical protein